MVSAGASGLVATKTLVADGLVLHSVAPSYARDRNCLRLRSRVPSRYQFDYGFRRLELRSVRFTSSSWSVCFERSVDATDVSKRSRQVREVCAELTDLCS